MKKKTWIVVLIVAVVAVAGFLVYRTIQKNKQNAASAYTTAPLAKGDLISMVGATGKVAANQTTNVSWQTSGRISKIPVKLGDKVTKGDLLAQLDPTSLSQGVISATADLVTAQQNLVNLTASATAKANAQMKLAQAKIDLKDAQDKRTSANYKRAGEATLEELEANYIIAEQDFETAQDNYKWVEDAAENDPRRAEGLLALAKAQHTRDTALANYNWANALPDANDVGKADATVQVAQATLDDAQREWDRLKDGPDQNDVAAAEARVEAAQSEVNMMSLNAPISGTITDVSSMEGDEVAPGQTSFRVDDLSRMIIDIQLAEVDISKVKLDQPAEITFDAINGKTYLGKVTQVGKVGIDTGSGVNFDVRVELTQVDQDVLPGMTAAVNIIVDRLNNVLNVPNRALKFLNGKRVVYVLQNGKATSVEVQIGDTSDTNTEIVSGNIKIGDLIILNPPTPTNFGGPGGGGPSGGGPGGGGSGGGG
jgi:HlyD family secretion protein